MAAAAQDIPTDDDPYPEETRELERDDPLRPESPDLLERYPETVTLSAAGMKDLLKLYEIAKNALPGAPELNDLYTLPMDEDPSALALALPDHARTAHADKRYGPASPENTGAPASPDGSSTAPSELAPFHPKGSFKPIPFEILAIIWKFLHAGELKALRNVSRFFNNSISDYFSRTKQCLKVNIPLSIVARSRSMIDFARMPTWPVNFAATVVQYGNLDALKFIRGFNNEGNPIPGFNPCPWDEDTCEAAVTFDKLDMLRWMRGFNSDNSRWTKLEEEICPWDNRVTAKAALTGNLVILKWLRGVTEDGWSWTHLIKRMCPWEARTITLAIQGTQNYNMMLWMRGFYPYSTKWTDDKSYLCPWDRTLTAAIAADGNLKWLEWAIEQGCPYDGTLDYNAARYNHKHILEWQHGKGDISIEACEGAAAGDHLELLQWLHLSLGIPLSIDVIYQAALKGHLDIIKWARERRCPWDEGVCEAAARLGYLDMLKWIRGYDPDDTQWTINEADICPWTEDVNFLAARNGHADVLLWAIRHGCPTSEWVCREAAAQGHLNALKVARGFYPDDTQWTTNEADICPWTEDVNFLAAENGHADVLLWAIRHGCPTSERVCNEAAAQGHLNALKVARGYNSDDTQWTTNEAEMCPWNDNVTFFAAQNGHAEVLLWALRHGCPRDGHVCNEAASRGYLNVLKVARGYNSDDTQWTTNEAEMCPWDDDVNVYAAQNGYAEVLLWTLRHGCPTSDRVCREAVRHGHLNALKVARGFYPDDTQWTTNEADICPWDDDLSFRAAKYGFADVLLWALRHGCPTSEFVCREAARHGHLNAFKVARGYNPDDTQWTTNEAEMCPWNDNVLWPAALNGHPDIITWALRHKCPRNVGICREAAAQGHLNALKAARGFNPDDTQWTTNEADLCPWNDEVTFFAAQNGHADVLLWALRHGCPRDVHVCTEAASCGHFNALKAARGFNPDGTQWTTNEADICPWDRDVVLCAESRGHIDIAVWAIMHGCPINDPCKFAAVHDRVDLLQWSRDHGFGIKDIHLEIALERGNTEVVEWIVDNTNIIDSDSD